MQNTHYSCQSLTTLHVFDKFSENTHTSNFMKIRLVGAQLFHTDRLVGFMKLTVAFRNFAKK
jgi:hypothetical protein